MRCEVLQAQNEKKNAANGAESTPYRNGKTTPITDLEVWREPTQRNALSIVSDASGNGKEKPLLEVRKKTLPKRYNLCDKYVLFVRRHSVWPIGHHSWYVLLLIFCREIRSEAPKPADNRENNYTENKCETLVDSAVPPRQRFVELQKLKSNCKAEDLLKLKQKCEVRCV